MTKARGMGQGAMDREVVAAVPAVTYRARSNTDAWTFTSVQGGLLERLGTGPEQLLRDPSGWILMVHREDRERVITAWRRAASDGHLEVEYRLQTRDGEDCWVHDVAVRDDGRSGSMVGIVTDLSEHHRADAVLQQLHDARWMAVTRLLRAAAVRDTTVQLFVHDMRSPLTAVAGLARTLHERGSQVDEADRARVLRHMVAASERVIGLVDDFARLWELPLDRAAVPVRTVQLSALVEGAMDEVGLPAGVAVDVGEVALETNAELLRRVLVGLVRNAVLHTREDTAVRVSASASDGWVTIEVQDDGPGIPEHVRDRLFDPHSRVSGDGRGMGIGLTLVHAAVELLGGDVVAIAPPAGGTIIRIELPRAPYVVEDEHAAL